MRQKSFCVKLFFVTSFILFLSELAFAGTPVPWGAKIIQDDIVITGKGEERRVVSYETKASKQELLDYYLREMPNRGYSLFMNGEQNLIFKKEEELVVVVVPPSQDGKTHFMISTVSMKSALDSVNPDSAGIKCEPIPLVPVYPGARCVNSVRLKSGGSRTAAYSTEDSNSAVLNFYRNQMPRYGWQLDKDVNLGDMMLKAMQGQQSQQQAIMQNIYENSRALYFINPTGNSCSVTAMNNPVDKKTTIININYADKALQQ